MMTMAARATAMAAARQPVRMHSTVQGHISAALQALNFLALATADRLVNGMPAMGGTLLQCRPPSTPSRHTTTGCKTWRRMPLLMLWTGPTPARMRLGTRKPGSGCSRTPLQQDATSSNSSSSRSRTHTQLATSPHIFELQTTTGKWLIPHTPAGNLGRQLQRLVLRMLLASAQAAMFQPSGLVH